jgi:hypothetical protein
MSAMRDWLTLPIVLGNGYGVTAGQAATECSEKKTAACIDICGACVLPEAFSVLGRDLRLIEPQTVMWQSNCCR